MADVFRKSALERLSSPEQLDKAITVSNPASWLALLGVTIIIAATVIWAVFGTLPATMMLRGITAGTDDAADGQVVECFADYLQAGHIKPGMNAIITGAADNNKRYEATVIGISFDDAELSDMDLVLGNNDIVVTVSLMINAGRLPERTLVTASIITEEAAPLSMLFKSAE